MHFYLIERVFDVNFNDSLNFEHSRDDFRNQKNKISVFLIIFFDEQNEKCV